MPLGRKHIQPVGGAGMVGASCNLLPVCSPARNIAVHVLGGLVSIATSDPRRNSMQIETSQRPRGWTGGRMHEAGSRQTAVCSRMRFFEIARRSVELRCQRNGKRQALLSCASVSEMADRSRPSSAAHTEHRAARPREGQSEVGERKQDVW